MAEIDVKIRLINDEAKRAVSDFENKLKGTDQAAKSLGQNATKAFDNIGISVGKAITKFDVFAANIASNLVLRAINSVGRAFSAVVDDVTSFEDALVGVQKTTDLSGEELKVLASRIRNLSKTIPDSTQDLLKLAQSAGQLGITGTDNLVRFSETVARLGVSTNLSGEEAAVTLARILKITGEAPGNVDKLGSAFVALGNKVEASEQEIANAANQVARSTAEFNLSSAQVTALGAALASMGIRAEGGGTAVGRAFRLISQSIDEGGDRLLSLSEITGIASDDLKKAFEEDATKVFQAFIVGLAKAQKAGQSTSKELAKIGLVGDEINKVLPAMAKNAESLQEAFDIANREFKDGTALADESNRAYATLSSQWKILINNITDIGRTIALFFLPAVKEVVRVLGDLSSTFATVAKDFSNFLKGEESPKKTLQELEAEFKTLGDQIIRLEKEAKTTSGSIRDGTKSYELLGDNLDKLKVKYADLYTEILKLRQEQEQTPKKPGGEGGEKEAQESAFFALIDSNKRANEQLALDNEIFRQFEVQAEAKHQEELIRTLRDGLGAQETVRLANRLKTLRDENKFAEANILIAENVAKAKQKIAKDEEAEQEKQKRRQVQFFGDLASAAKSGNKTFQEIARIGALGQMAIRAKEAWVNAYTFGNGIGGPALGTIFGATAFAAVASQAAALGGSIGGEPSAQQQEIKNIDLGVATREKELAGGNVTEERRAVLEEEIRVLEERRRVLQLEEDINRLKGEGAVQPAFATGGIVPGSSLSGDNVLARVNSGEMILNREQQTNLLKLIEGGAGSSQPQEIVVNTSIQLDGKEIGKAVSRQVADGLKLGEVV